MRYLALASAIWLFAAAPTLAAERGESSTAAHIAAIENGLTPPLLIAGRPRPASNLLERMRETKTPGVSIAFFEKGRIVWTRTYGLADVASGRPVTPDTLFQAASISKSVTAAGALRLVEAGSLDLDQDVNARLSGWRVPDSAFTAEKKVTLRGLLSHTAGLTVHGYDGYAPGVAVPTTIQILNGAAPANSLPVVSTQAPGQYWSYSGGGFVVTQLLMTETSGEAFPALMRRLVLTPAHMATATFEQNLPPALAAKAASGYLQNGDAVPGGHHLYPEMAAAGLWTTAADLARFAIAVQDSIAGVPHPLLGKAETDAMMTRTLNDWGLGVNLGPADGPAHFEHSGDNAGFHAYLIAFSRGERQGVAIMSNSDGASLLIPEIVRAVAQSYNWGIDRPKVVHLAKVSPAAMAELAGVYEIPGLATVTVTSEGDRLYAAAPALGPQRYELLPETQSTFFILENGLSAEFARSPDGRVATMAISGSIGHFQAIRKP
jgi:CubicO group peptidase (beta-lactamase class C family)